LVTGEREFLLIDNKSGRDFLKQALNKKVFSLYGGNPLLVHQGALTDHDGRGNVLGHLGNIYCLGAPVCFLGSESEI
jgi:hypothetical protein